MRASVLTDVGSVEVEERELPEPGPNEVLVLVGACGVCMTDFHMYHGSFDVETPLVLGHESAGEVVATGDDVKTADVGDRVAMNPVVPCHACKYCKRGETHLCEHNTSIGGAGETIIDGAFAEYVRVPETNVEDVGDMPYERAALAEPLACCIHGVDRVDIGHGDSVAIIGAGPIGLLLLQTFRDRGAAPVIVSELDAERRQLAEELGADVTIDPAEEDPVEVVDSIVGKVDVAVEAVGMVPTIEQANEMVAKGGDTLVFGVPSQDATLEIDPFDVYFREADYRGTYALDTDDFQRAVRLLEYGRIETEPLVTETLGLSELPTAFERMENTEGLKKLVRPGRETAEDGGGR
ncbi:zinc-dependent alcohol dehydrogenase family protein [Halospeciosus flavus]|uniref:Zinc-dependent alcohol dehydrogenase family protein n=1 Tax=Halospeciosus flavus TaxID=3032283 RepID=A0ABD5YVU0_9EURY